MLTKISDEFKIFFSASIHKELIKNSVKNELIELETIFERRKKRYASGNN